MLEMELSGFASSGGRTQNGRRPRPESARELLGSLERIAMALTGIAVVSIDLLQPRPVAAQCSDGTAEQEFGGDIFGCAGSWQEPGLVDELGTPVEANPACDRPVGDDANEAPPPGCRSANLCAADWRLCKAEDLIGGCGAASEPLAEGDYFVAAESQCRVNDAPALVGCGWMGCAAAPAGPLCPGFDWSSTAPVSTTDFNACQPLNRESCNVAGDFIAGTGWECLSTGTIGRTPARTVVKDGQRGGVLCCKGCDCEEDGLCLHEGERSGCDQCVSLGGDFTLIEDPNCGDGGVAEDDAGIADDDAGTASDGGAEEEDAAFAADANVADAANAPDLDFPEGEVEPAVSFRGAGGCSCRTGGETRLDPSWMALGIGLIMARRRRSLRRDRSRGRR